MPPPTGWPASSRRSNAESHSGIGASTFPDDPGLRTPSLREWGSILPSTAGRRAPYVGGMAVELNHTVVHVSDRKAAAEWVADMLGLDPPRPFGPFYGVDLANGSGS